MDKIDAKRCLNFSGLTCDSMRTSFDVRHARTAIDWKCRAGHFETMGQIGAKHSGFIQSS
jgi:hypothetical protein